MQAAILSVKLRHLDAWTRVRRERAAAYNAMLAGIVGLETPIEGEGREHVYHLYVVRHDRRDELATYLAAAGIQSVVNYPVSLPFLPAYQRFGHVPEEFPRAWANQSRILSLPIFPEMTASQQAQVADALRRFVG
jgi:dTDP-4-amino-4,6-dideoxygalactose transaminase